ncbi:hypothetical protein So717_06030 [Roseobacter cerasinus]|uniref:PEP-CTERM protein-sorting domain-containing protein n=1 Tax=Roseobacter cerasinus TaxID=2602289 RepID=A0A640VN45_9RHOB|nr:VPLPA-CTERM sorting domain-containing protein [Roseobacter cerasinus]GFE48850.1 hypothetical protein So717_06030 [Roseobacter cerasinus]
MMKSVCKAAAAALMSVLGATAATAATVTMDFEDLTANLGNEGAWTSYQFANRTFGISWSGGRSEGANIFDTACQGGTSDCRGDDDLLPGGVAGASSEGVGGNVLIRQRTRDRGGDLANDQANSGTITFTLLAGSALSWVGASAVDDGRFTFSTRTGGTNTVLGVISGLDDNETEQLTFDALSPLISLNDSFSIFFEGSGAVDSFVFETVDENTPAAVPVPAALPLMLAGLGGLGLLARRRRARANRTV